MSVVFEHATLLDCTGRDPQPNVRIVVEDGRIRRLQRRLAESHGESGSPDERNSAPPRESEAVR